MKDLTVDVSTFEDLRNGNFLYVDKTEYLWKLIRPAKAKYFLSRPRRFGKSLTLSTLVAIFEGKKELFEGLAIYDKPYDWAPHPVIHLTLASCCCRTPDDLREYLIHKLQKIVKKYSLDVTLNPRQLSLSFGDVIEQLHDRQGSVVVLIDEYDKPLLENLLAPEAPAIRDILEEFYSPLKEFDSLERFVFLTGVTKFCHVSLFSKLNNLQDLTLDADYATMLGYTQEELESNFADWLADAESRQALPHAEFLEKIKKWYDGFRFTEDAESVYNPVSVANFLKQKGKFSNYWFETGTPAFLMELLQTRSMNLSDLLSRSVPAFVFNAFEINDIDPATLLIQTGYLTIRATETVNDLTEYWLDFPNLEVSQSFYTRLLNAFSSHQEREVVDFSKVLSSALASGDLPKFQKAMEVFFAGIPYDVHRKSESNFQNIFFAIFKILGYSVHAESRTSDGRIDAVVETASHVYLFEFKLNRDKTALAQIKEKEYFKPWLLSTKKITLVGVNFSTRTGKLSRWQHEDI